MAQLCTTTPNAKLHMMRSAIDRQFAGNPCSTQAAPVFNSLLTMHALHREETNYQVNVTQSSISKARFFCAPVFKHAALCVSIWGLSMQLVDQAPHSCINAISSEIIAIYCSAVPAATSDCLYEIYETLHVVAGLLSVLLWVCCGSGVGLLAICCASCTLVGRLLVFLSS